MEGFLSVLNLFWQDMFSEAHYRVIEARQTDLRKPKNLLPEDDVRCARDYNVDTIQKITADVYRFDP